MTEVITKTTCPYCGVGCGVAVGVVNGEVQPVVGDTEHPANRGRLCVKGSALHETLNPQRRLTEPYVDGAETSWDTALDQVATRLHATIAEHGPQSVALYLSGQLLTEDYYVANKLWKGFIGSANVDTNSRLCMSSAVAAHVRSFGEDVVPGCYEDLEIADLIVLVGSNAAWAHPVVYQRIQKARKERPQLRLVVIDPRRTDTCDQADLHLPIAPGSDAWLFNGLLAWLDSNGQVDSSYIEQHTSGFGTAIAAAHDSSPSIQTVAEQCGLDAAAVAVFFEWFAATQRTVTVFSQGINQSSSGTDKGNAIINCHLATGRVGKPGASPFSITGQPNAMGGREVGGLANMLAVHRGFEPESVAAVAKFWNAPDIAAQPGLKAIQLFEAIERGEVRFLWILATNPLVSMPDAERWRRALQRCDTVVVSDCVRQTDTTAVADILLPAVGWGEKDGTVTNSERCISRQRAFLPPAGAARPDWWALSQIGKRLGHDEAFGFRSARDVFTELAELTAINRDTPLTFDISGWAALTHAEYQALAPRQWPIPTASAAPAQRLFGDGRYATPDRRARFVAIEPRLPVWPPGPAGASLPYVFNTGRARDQWHTMTRTAESGRLNRHRAEPYLDIHPDDAAAIGLAAGDIAEVANERGKLWLRTRIDSGQRRGSLFAPIHWNDQFAARARVDALIPAVGDPQSGQPELKHARVAVERVKTQWQALLLSTRKQALPRDHYWAGLPCDEGWLYWLAGDESVDAALERLLALQTGAPTLSFTDPGSGEQRFAWLAQGALTDVLLLIPDGPITASLPEPWWLAERLGQPLQPLDRRVLLSGAAADGSGDDSAVICSCFQVSEQRIRSAVSEGAHCSDLLGERLRCGTNCGSCIPELNRIIRDVASPSAVVAVTH